MGTHIETAETAAGPIFTTFAMISGLAKAFGRAPTVTRPKFSIKKRHAEGRYEGRNSRGISDWAVGYPLDGHADQCGEPYGQKGRQKPWKTKNRHKKECAISSYHKYIAMGKIYQPKYAIHHRISYGDERIQTAQRQAIHKLLYEGLQVHSCSPSSHKIIKQRARSNPQPSLPHP